MRRLPLVCVLALGIAAPAALAFPQNDGDGTLSVKRGKGYVGLNFKGAVIGRLGHGRVTISDPIDGDGSGPEFWGCDTIHDVNDTTTTCRGDDIHFRAIGGKYRLNLRGTGIFVSAVGQGIVRLDGRGDQTDRPDGVYSFNDEDYQSLPDDPLDFQLTAPAQG